MTSNHHSPLAERADIVLDIGVEREACPHDLAPTTSTTVTLVMGDALAVALLEKRHFTEDDFAQLHPAGALGRRLLLRIDDVMYTSSQIAQVNVNASIDDVILEISSKRFGATCVTDEADSLIGIITDGDLRRLLRNKKALNGLVAGKVMTKNPHAVHQGMLAVKVLEIMQEMDIMQMIVCR